MFFLKPTPLLLMVTTIREPELRPGGLGGSAFRPPAVVLSIKSGCFATGQNKDCRPTNKLSKSIFVRYYD